MKKILHLLLTFSLLVNSGICACAKEALPQIQMAEHEAKVETIKGAIPPEFKLMDVPIKEDSTGNKTEGTPNGASKKVKSTELVEVVPDGLKEYNPDAFNNEGFDSEQGSSKMQMAKNITVYAVKTFVADLKNFVMFYPLFKVSSFITFCAWVFPLFFLYKKTGIDVPGVYSDFAMRHSNWHILLTNLYNVIPMTLASFIFKYGQEAYFRFKTT